jgi:hypothetical protein
MGGRVEGKGREVGGLLEEKERSKEEEREKEKERKNYKVKVWEMDEPYSLIFEGEENSIWEIWKLISPFDDGKGRECRMYFQAQDGSLVFKDSIIFKKKESEVEEKNDE